MSNWIRLAAAGAALWLASLSASAVTLSVDPSSVTSDISDSVFLDVVISELGDGVAPTLGAYDLAIGYDAAVLAFGGATLGTGLDPFGLGSISGVFDLGGTIDIFEVSLDSVFDLDITQPASFVLFTLEFTALAAGVSPIEITVDGLSDALGGALTADSIADGMATVRAPTTELPAPGVLALCALVLSVLVSLGPRRQG